MKTAIVPAQITTVEDKVAGNLSMQQLVLLVFPLFVAGGLYAIGPPSFSIEVYKFAIVTAVTLFCLASAIRIKGTLVVYWAIRLIKYWSRPRFHVYKHSDSFMRPRPIVEIVKKVKTVKHTEVKRQTALPGALLMAQYSERKFSIAIQKGGLHVSYAKEK